MLDGVTIQVLTKKRTLPRNMWPGLTWSLPLRERQGAKFSATLGETIVKPTLQQVGFQLSILSESWQRPGSSKRAHDGPALGKQALSVFAEGIQLGICSDVRGNEGNPGIELRGDL